MHSPLTTVVLCIFAQAASAQCIAPTTAAQHARPAAQVQVTQVQVTKPGAGPAAPARQGGELIKAAAAGTRDDAPPVVSRDTRHIDGEDQPRRGGTAMLLAALALMSGIALRRFGGPRE